MLDDDRQEVLSFLSNSQSGNPFSQGYAPSSQQVVGILKQMGDEMLAGLKEATALSKKIETLLKRIGDLGVALALMKNDLTDTEEALMADKEFLAGLDKACAAKKAEMEERTKTRADELAALADAIRMLNDD